LTLRLPPPLRAGDTVFITAPSSGVGDALRPRFERALEALRARGLQIRLGRHLAGDGVVASAAERAQEWQAALLDSSVHWVCAPWGGELAIELLPHLDFERLSAAAPKWVSGFSDLSTLALPLVLRAGWATVHSANLMELGAAELDATTAGLFDLLMGPQPRRWTQLSSAAYASAVGADWAREPSSGWRFDTPTRVRRLRDDMPLRAEGRLIGGCLETLARLAGTRFAPWQALPGPKLLVLEACEAPPFEVARTLHSLALHGWFDDLAGLLIGRSAAPAGRDFDGWSVLHELFAGFAGLVALDLDIGHLPPQWSWVQGAWGQLELDGEGAAWLHQQLG
jgi:muramoyltetrapeptide carboxypeptidase